MKIGIVSDIHGNHLALAAVLEEARDLGVERLLVLGDLVGYYYHPGEVLDSLAEWETVVIQGNHERMLARLRDDPAQGEVIRERYGQGLSIALEQLDQSRIDMLTALPVDTAVTIDETRFHLFHGTPWDPDGYLYPDAPVEDLARCAEIDANVILMGNTHHQFVHAGGGPLLLNPGSVGQARDRGTLAAWAMFETATGVILPRRTPYDVASLEEEVRRRDPDLPAMRDVLRRTPRALRRGEARLREPGTS